MAIYLNKVIKSLTGDVFLLDKYDFAILNKFAVIGETTRHQIVTTQDKKTVSKRIDVLFRTGFLVLRKSTPFRNQPHKSTKYFGLSLKGFLASLWFCNVEDNYLTKKFLKEIKNKSLSKLILDNMKNNLIRTLSYSSLMGITLDKMNNILSWFEENHELSGLSNEDATYFETLDNLCDQTFQELRNQNFDNPNIFHYAHSWQSSINDLSNGISYSKIIKNLSELSNNAEPLHGLTVNESWQNLIDKFKKEFKMDLTK